MKEEILVKVEGVSKKFCKDLKTSLRYGVQDITREVFGFPVSEKLRKMEFWAVNDISFELKRGECLGLIGHNGAGKSTLLKILNGLIKPDKGKITMRGRVGALIELGAGFNPILTGRENIYVNGQILGFTKKEISSKIDSIIDFAEIGDYLDTPVQNYSSGMKVRLGFAVAAQMEPDVLIIDEVLAVGDLGFQIKCYNKINDLIKKTSVIFVSHNIQQVARLCDNLLYMESGKEKFQTRDIYQGVEKYLDSYERNKNKQEEVISSAKIKIKEISLNGHHKDDKISLKYKSSLVLDAKFDCSEDISNVVIGVSINDRSLKPVASFISTPYDFDKGLNSILFKSDENSFNGGTYRLTMIVAVFDNYGINDSRTILIRNENLFSFSVERKALVLLPSSYYLDGSWTFNSVKYE